MRRASLAASLGGALAALLLPCPAAANGRFPAAGQIVVDPVDGSHIVVRTTYGLLTTRDAGQTWDWICEQAVEWTGQFDPAMAITADGTVLAGIYDHLGVGHDECTWERPAALDQKNVADVSTERADPSAAVAIALDGGTFATQLWASPDDAVTWAQAGVDLPADFVGLTVDVAPSDAQRVYVSGLYGAGVGAIARTIDGGAIWEQFDIPGADANRAPYLAAVDPNDPDKVYVRLNGVPGRLLVSTDGGETWGDAFVGEGLLKGFALSPDGATILVGGETEGVHRAAAADLQFQKVSDVGVQCLAWAAAGVYACAGEFNDGFTVGLSTDQGASFEPVMHLACVRGPLACAAETNVGQTCAAAWPATAELLDQPSCAPDAGPDGGGTGGSGGETGAAGGGNADGGGCGCRVGGDGEARAALLALGALAGIGALRARRRGRVTGSVTRS